MTKLHAKNMKDKHNYGHRTYCGLPSDTHADVVPLTVFVEWYVWARDLSHYCKKCLKYPTVRKYIKWSRFFTKK